MSRYSETITIIFMIWSQEMRLANMVVEILLQQPINLCDGSGEKEPLTQFLETSGPQA